VENKFTIGAYFLKNIHIHGSGRPPLVASPPGLNVCIYCAARVCVCRTIKTRQTQQQGGGRSGGRGWWNSRRAPVALVNGNQRKSSIEHRTRIGNQQLLMVHGEGGGEQFRGRYGAPEYGDAAHN